MRHHDHYSWIDRIAFGQNLEDRIGLAGHPDAVDKPTGANPPPARQ
jgi:hypothetical protein